MLKNVHYDGKVVFGRKKTTVVFENGKKVTKRLKQQSEDMLIVEFIEQKLSISEIAKLHNRNTGGIRARLKKLRLIE